MRFTGHLDLALAWERLLRRANLPVVYSKGYNPQPRINLAAALPLGITSECELLDVWLDGESLPEEVQERLDRSAPPGLTVLSVREVPLKAPSLQSQLVATVYHAAIPPQPEHQERIEGLLAAETLPRERRGKRYDLRPLVEGVWLEANGIGMRLAALPSATGRPDELLLTLGIDPLALRIHRRELILKPESASTCPSESGPTSPSP